MRTGKITLVAALGSALALTSLPLSAQQAQGADDARHAARGDHDGHRGRAHVRDRQGMRIEGMMETFDTNGDGGISQEEVDAVRMERLQAFDADGDGALSLAEFEALWLDAMHERMVDRFQKHDDDGDGAVTVEEFSEDFSGMVARSDRNGDGVLNADDMRRGRGGPDRNNDVEGDD